MFPQSAEVKTFLESLKDRETSEAILLSDKEATEAVRKAMRSRPQQHPRCRDWCEYANRIKDVIAVLRYDTAPNPFDPETRRLLGAIKRRSIR